MYKNIAELIGNTPLIDLTYAFASPVRLFGKLERANPLGSVKDRAALYMLRDAESKGQLSHHPTIVEPTSGNTGIGLAYLCAAKGYRLILTMPETMSVERRNLLTALGAELVLTDGAAGMAGAIAEAQRIVAQTPSAVMMSQFENPANALAHRETTGPEIWRDTGGLVDVVVAGVGTGGTITGIAQALKPLKPQLRMVAVEPAESPVLSGGESGTHGIQGIGAGFVPALLQRDLIDQIVTISTEEAYSAARTLNAHGLFVGISSGAAWAAALQIAKQAEMRDKTIVVILPDTGERYLSTALFSNV